MQVYSTVQRIQCCSRGTVREALTASSSFSFMHTRSAPAALTPAPGPHWRPCHVTLRLLDCQFVTVACRMLNAARRHVVCSSTHDPSYPRPLTLHLRPPTPDPRLPLCLSIWVTPSSLLDEPQSHEHRPLTQEQEAAAHRLPAPPCHIARTRVPSPHHDPRPDPSITIHRLPSTVHRLPSTVHHPPFPIHPLPFIVHQPRRDAS